jgi:HSP20 family protein
MPIHVISALPEGLSEQVREQLRRLLMHLEELPTVGLAPGAWTPPVDLCEMSDAIVIRIELPGVRQEDLRVSILDNALKIEGRKQRVAPSGAEAEKPLRFVCLERSYGSFARTIALKWPVEVEKISADLVDGVLQIRLPKTKSCGREVLIPINA